MSNRKGWSTSPYIVCVIYKGRAYRGDSTIEVKMAMHYAGLSSGEMSNIFLTSRQSLGQQVRTYKAKYPERSEAIEIQEKLLSDFKRLYAVDGLTIPQIASRLGIERHYAQTIRREIFPSGARRNVIFMSRRHEQLCRLLFGPEYEPGPHFIAFVQDELKRFDCDNEAINAYYIEGATSKESVNRLGEIRRLNKVLSLKYQRQQLIERDIICPRKKLPIRSPLRRDYPTE